MSMVRVLVVEDSPTQAQQLALLLEEAGFAVATAADAEEGFARLAREAFDVVLTDLVLPGESGFDLCRRIKSARAHRHIPVVVLTSQADPLNVLRGLEAGADGFMTKNRQPEEIIGRLRRTLDHMLSPTKEKKTRVVFLDCQFEIAAGREQLMNVLMAAFEDVVHLNHQYQTTEAALRKTNGQLQESIRAEQEALQQLKWAQSQLVQAEKLSSLGQMVAGIAHEINNPLAFISSNVTVLERDTDALRRLLALYQEADGTLAGHQPPLLDRIRSLSEQVDLDYIVSNLPGLLTRSRDGLQRIGQIVKNLRNFARLDEGERKEADINEGIESTVNILQGEAKKRGLAVELDLAALPRVTCFPAKINQVVLNLISNALDACAAGGKVTVRSRSSPEGVEIHVLDTGRGIDPAIRDKIFDPFFTTKPPGKGTGLGLSISYGIVQDHGGRLSFESVVNQGTHFTLCLPWQAPANNAGQIKDKPC